MDPERSRADVDRTFVTTLAPFAILTALAYLPAFDNGFRADDFAFLYHLSTTGWQQSLFEGDPAFAFYRPGALTLFRIEFALFGWQAGWFLAVNLLLHLAIGVSGGIVLARLGAGARGAALAAGLFLVGYGHYGKAVMWASNTGPLVAHLLVLLALVAMGSRWPIRVREPAGYLCLLMAPAFHESATLFAWLVLLLLPRQAAAVRRVRLFALASLTLATLALRIALAPTLNSYVPDGVGAAAAVPTFVRYFSLLLLPTQTVSGVARVATVITGSTIVAIQVAIGAFVLIGTVMLFRANDTTRRLCAWLWLSLLPFAFIKFPQGWLELRYLYCAALPWCGLVVWLLHTARGARWKRVVIPLIVVGSLAATLALERKYDGDSHLPTLDPRAIGSVGYEKSPVVDVKTDDRASLT